MKSFLDNPQLKQDLVAEIKWHQEQDMIIKGTYGEQVNGVFKGCAVGCALNSLNRINNSDLATSNHSRFEPELGIPREMARLVDNIFEGLPDQEAVLWPARFVEAVPVGVDLQPVLTGFKVWVLEKMHTLVAGLNIEQGLKQQILDANRQVADYLKNPDDADAATVAVAAADAADAYADARAAARVDVVAYYAADATYAAATVDAAGAARRAVDAAAAADAADAADADADATDAAADAADAAAVAVAVAAADAVVAADADAAVRQQFWTDASNQLEQQLKDIT